MTCPSSTLSAANKVVVPLPLVVVRHVGRSALLQRQTRLRSVQRLHLALLLTAQNSTRACSSGAMYRPHDVFEFLDKLGIARDLEAAHQVGYRPFLRQ